MWEIPAGKLDAEDTEPLDAAKRELLEETGVSADNWQLLAVVANSPGYSDEFSWVYLATGLHQGDSAADGVEEAHMTLHWLPVDDALAMIDEEKLVHSLSVVGLTRARLKSIV
jgi:ADP-ribose pyrophosphatase